VNAGSVTLPQGFERQAMMCTSSQSACSTPAAATSGIPQASLWAERTYQGLTVAAVLWILGSLWLFR
jgi:hypothetical protein